MKFEKGGGSQNAKPTCVTCGKKQYGECQLGIECFYGCVKEGHKVRHFPNIASRGKEGKEVASSVPKDDATTKNIFYALRPRGSKPDANNEGKSLYLFLVR